MPTRRIDIFKRLTDRRNRKTVVSRKRNHQRSQRRKLTFERQEARNLLAAAILTSPPPETYVTDTTTTFQWTQEGAGEYWLRIGSTPGVYDIYNNSGLTSTSVTVSGIPTNERFYVQLGTETDSGLYFFSGQYVYNTDFDSDGIDDLIDPNPSVQDAQSVFPGADSTLTVLGSQRVASLQVSQELYDQVSDGMTWNQMQELTGQFYEQVQDDFDFLIFTNDQSSSASYSGINFGVQNDVTGTGTSLYDYTNSFGSNGNLQSAIHLSSPTTLRGGPSLHEIAHRWGMFLDSVPTAVSRHWGYSSANGQLGGWDSSTLVDLGDGTYQADGFGTIANGGNSLPYSPIELYLMGLIPAAEVPDLQIATGVSNSTYSNGTTTFTADAITNMSIEDIIAIDGERVPNHLNSQKNFKAAYIVITPDPLSPNEWVDFDRQAYEFEVNGDNGISSFNFYEATGGRATLELSGLLDSIKTEVSRPFADSVIRYDPLFGGGPAPTEPNAIIDTAALGAPDFPVGGGVSDPGTLALGSGGLVELQFDDNLLTNSGQSDPDLRIHEIGQFVERTFVAVRPTGDTLTLLDPALDTNGDGFFELGIAAGGIAELDIDQVFPGFAEGILQFDAIQLVDDPNNGGTGGTTVGADIDAVEALSTVSQFVVTNSLDDGAGSLRQAMLDANETVGRDRIRFDIPGSGPHSIPLQWQLPMITDSVSLDATTQTGWNGTPMIEISGASLDQGDGFFVYATDSVIRGFAINRMPGLGIGLAQGNNVIESNYIGTNLAGDAAATPASTGIFIQPGSNGNRIGTNGDGIADEVEGNLISGHGGFGIFVQTDFNVIAGNKVGTDAVGTSAIPNGITGVLLTAGASDNFVGSIEPGTGNIIAFNGAAGVGVVSGMGNSILGNAIFQNGSLGIDLSPAGANVNDLGDSDTGPNGLQNHPTIQRAVVTSSTTDVVFELDTAAGNGFRVEFFWSEQQDPSGRGEGQGFLGAVTIGQANAGKSVHVRSFAALPDQAAYLSATITDSAGNTSEFSNAIEIESSDDLVLDFGDAPVSTPMFWSNAKALSPTSPYDSNDEGYPSVATDDQGNWVATWSSSNDTPVGPDYFDWDIYFARSSDDGQTWSTPQLLDASATSRVSADGDVRVNYLGRDQWMATWTSVKVESGGGAYDVDVMSARSVDGGQTWSSPTPINSQEDGYTRDDSLYQILPNGENNWVALWDSRSSTIVPPYTQAVISRSSDNGQTWGAPEILNVDQAYTYGLVAGDYMLEIHPGGDWILVGSTNNDLGGTIGTDQDVIISRSVDNGQTWSAPQPLSDLALSDTNVDDQGVRLTLDEQGNAIVAWSAYDFSSSDASIMASSSADGGLTWSDPHSFDSYNFTFLNDGSGTPQYRTVNDQSDERTGLVTADGLGNWIATWTSNDVLGFAAGDRVWFAISSDNGQSWSIPAPLSLSTQVHDGFSIAASSSGRWVSAFGASDRFVAGERLGTDSDIVFQTATLEGFPTLVAQDGARHIAVGPRLGNTRDAEIDGQPSPNADGDGSDEDGVFFGGIVPGEQAGINIELQNADDALVDAWIDFDQDGMWDEDEQILDSVSVSSGLQTLNYNAPPDATTGATFARVRVSSAGGLSPTGLAADGEVEDYAVTIGASIGNDSVTINDTRSSRSELTSIEVLFEGIAEVLPTDFELRNTTTNQLVTGIAVSQVVSDGSTLATLTFTGGPSVISGTNPSVLPTLANGNYELRYRAKSETLIDSFFRKYGDDDASDQVGLADFAAFRATFGLDFDAQDLNNGFNSGLDADRDGNIGLTDFAAFRSGFGN
ncbi:BNR/Asp-box repeat protein [Rubripirellula obstinata]|uniref:BNR/Asp-box repeat protein n=1 Tax=Rubripirellula obstinata TaxID=406547 RepID=A0A5B1CLX8_9BACT|nr:GEVED domain-containing protein [Rubripirellula obstinata]KAA1260344.1 BNR/Asp-box repeat protein [Rubripirellula obstinata]